VEVEGDTPSSLLTYRKGMKAHPLLGGSWRSSVSVVIMLISALLNMLILLPKSDRDLFHLADFCKFERMLEVTKLLAVLISEPTIVAEFTMSEELFFVSELSNTD
jgi:hypothetical protein